MNYYIVVILPYDCCSLLYCLLLKCLFVGHCVSWINLLSSLFTSPIFSLFFYLVYFLDYFPVFSLNLKFLLSCFYFSRALSYVLNGPPLYRIMFLFCGASISFSFLFFTCYQWKNMALSPGWDIWTNKNNFAKENMKASALGIWF